jgi:hypothetical protein
MNQKIYNLMSVCSFFLLLILFLGGAGESNEQVAARWSQYFVRHDDPWVIGKLEIRDTDEVTVLGGFRTVTTGEGAKKLIVDIDGTHQIPQMESTIPQVMREDGMWSYRAVPITISIGDEIYEIPAGSHVLYAYGIPWALETVSAQDDDTEMIVSVAGQPMRLQALRRVVQ